MSHVNQKDQDLQNEKHSATRKTALAMAIGMVLGVGTGTAFAVASTPLMTGVTLKFNAGGAVCTSGGPVSTCAAGGTDMGGSYFSMDQALPAGAQPGEKTPISAFVRGDGTSGIVLGSVLTSSGQHTNIPNGSESPAIDNPWNFFANTGMHNLSTGVSLISDLGAGTYTLDFSGWGVNWGNYGPGGLPTIDMGQVATIVCNPTDCGQDSNFVLDMAVHVPVAFTSVPYTLHLEGTIQVPGTPPFLVDDTAKTIVGNPIDINVTANDTVPPDGLNLNSVAVVSAATHGVTDATLPNGKIRYTPATGPNYSGADSFTYTVDSANGVPAAAPATVSVDVQTNVAPVAADDTLEVSTAVLNNTSQTVAVLDNDTDANNAPGLPGGIDATTVTIVDPPASGTCTANANGTITYAKPVSGAVAGDFTCTYQVKDIDTFGTPLLSNLATLSISVTSTTSDWPTSVASNIIPILFFEPGVPGDPIDLSVPATGGSYFSMQMTQTRTIYTVLEPGPAGGVVIGHTQPGTGAHTGFPDNTEKPGVDQPWQFFSNTGLHYTKDGGITGNPDGTLNFARKWFVNWGGIPAIDMGGDTTGHHPEDLGFATIHCSNPTPCANGSSFELDYDAHVPTGDPSGFGGVPYGLRMVGTVGFLDNTLLTSAGTISSQTRLLADDPLITSNPDAGVKLQCVGDCFDYTITGVTPSSRVSIVFPLAGGVPRYPVWRILDNGTWRDFDESGGDSIQSAALAPGATQCPPAGDVAYGALTTGHSCVQLSVADNGLNDLDTTAGTIGDASGMGGGGPTIVDTRTSGTSGCSVMGDNASPLQRADWGLLAGFIAWLGWNRSRRAQKH